MLGLSLLVVIAVAAAYSRQKCIEQGKPWFRAGGTRRTRKATPPPGGMRQPKRRFSSEAALPPGAIRPPKRRFSSEATPPQSEMRPPKRRFSSEVTRPVRTQPAVGNRALSRSLRKLNELTRDRRTSERLVRHVSQMHPDRSVDWCIEKAVYDIERDRMAR